MENNTILKQELKEINDRINYLKQQIELGKALTRLHENEDFKKLILQDFFKEEANRIFELLTAPSTLKRDVIQNLNDKLGAQRILKTYFSVKEQNAASAIEQIEEEEKYKKELLSRDAIDVKIEEKE